MKLNSIKFKAFGPFKDLQIVDNLSNGLYAIKGFNKNTGSSSGSGKTSFHLPISYALGYCPFYDSDLQNWTTDEKVQVELNLTLNGQEVVIKKGKETSIRLGANDPISGSSKAVNALIQQNLGIPLSLLEALTYREQRERGRFLKLKDSEKKEFLAQLLGLDEIDGLIEKTKKEVVNLKKDLEKQTEIYTSVKSIIKAPQPIKLIESTETLGYIKSAEEGVQELNLAYTVLKGEISVDLAKIKELKEKKFSPQNLPNLYDQYNTLILQRELANQQLKALPKINSSTVEIDKSLEKIKNELHTAIHATCFNCNRPWSTDLSVEQLESQSKELSRQKDEILNLKALREAAVSECNTKIESLKAATATLIKSNDAFKLKSLQDTVAKKEAEVKVLEEKIAPINAKIAVIVNKINVLDSNIKLYKDRIKEINKENKEKQETFEKETVYYQDNLKILKAKETLISDLQSEISQQEDFASLLKGFLDVIFQEVLQELSKETNDLLKFIPNVSTATITFNTEFITTKDIVKQEIRPVIVKNGFEVSLKAGISGGQSSSIELAVDLALANIISKRTGKMPGWLILDEPFEGLGVIEKESCLELLKQAAKDRIVMVIDHTTETKEYFDKFINIESNDDVSYIKSIESN